MELLHLSGHEVKGYGILWLSYTKTNAIHMAESKLRRTFTKEYKLDVIAQSYQRSNIAELAGELGLRPKLIYRWRAEYKHNPEGSFPGNGIPGQTPEEAELARLKAENAELRLERDILKKAIGIFGKTNG